MSLPVDMLVNEHKLIIQAVDAIKKRISVIEAIQTVDPHRIRAIVDFFRIYADRFHHGKEEGILFRALYQKKIQESDTKVMKDLIQEHAFARKSCNCIRKSQPKLWVR